MGRDVRAPLHLGPVESDQVAVGCEEVRHAPRVALVPSGHQGTVERADLAAAFGPRVAVAHAGPESGRESETEVPPPGTLRMARWPPRAAARSRMPTMPAPPFRVESNPPP